MVKTLAMDCLGLFVMNMLNASTKWHPHYLFKRTKTEIYMFLEPPSFT